MGTTLFSGLFLAFCVFASPFWLGRVKLNRFHVNFESIIEVFNTRSLYIFAKPHKKEHFQDRAYKLFNFSSQNSLCYRERERTIFKVTGR